MSLSLTDLAFRYPGAETDLLRDINLLVKRGESVALMAPSGRGKTTLLGVAGLLLPPRTGVIAIDGVARTTRDSADLLGSTVAWILQTVNLLPRRTLLDNTALPALASGATVQEASTRAEELLVTVGLDPRDNRQARTLSGGEAQRAGVARALMARPSVLLADEPTANLDANTAAVVARSLFRAASTTALLVTTHDEAVGALADRIVRIRVDGTLEAD